MSLPFDSYLHCGTARAGIWLNIAVAFFFLWSPTIRKSLRERIDVNMQSLSDWTSLVWLQCIRDLESATAIFSSIAVRTVRYCTDVLKVKSHSDFLVQESRIGIFIKLSFSRCCQSCLTTSKLFETLQGEVVTPLFHNTLTFFAIISKDPRKITITLPYSPLLHLPIYPSVCLPVTPAVSGLKKTSGGAAAEKGPASSILSGWMVFRLPLIVLCSKYDRPLNVRFPHGYGCALIVFPSKKKIEY